MNVESLGNSCSAVGEGTVAVEAGATVLATVTMMTVMVLVEGAITATKTGVEGLEAEVLGAGVVDEAEVQGAGVDGVEVLVEEGTGVL